MNYTGRCEAIPEGFIYTLGLKKMHPFEPVMMLSQPQRLFTHPWKALTVDWRFVWFCVELPSLRELYRDLYQTDPRIHDGKILQTKLKGDKDETVYPRTAYQLDIRVGRYGSLYCAEITEVKKTRESEIGGNRSARSG